MKQVVVTYVRVSTEEQAHGQSPEVQRQAVVDYAAGHDLEIAAAFEEAESAFRSGRSQFSEMVEFLRKNRRVTGVLVYHLDRISRNLTDYALLVEELGMQLISATQQLPNNSTGRLMGDMQASWARFFSAQLSERVEAAMINKAKKGGYPSLAPTGYLNDRLEKTILPDPDQGPIIPDLFETYAETNMSLMQLVRWAKKRGLRTRNGNPMARGAIYGLLTNPFYYGIVRWREMEYQGTHAPLISKALFDKVQDKLRGRGRKKTERRFPFRGILVCGHCGCKITATLAKGKYIYYHCTNGKGKCTQGYINQKELAQLCESVIDAVQIPEDVARMLLHEVRRNEEKRADTLRKRVEKMTAEKKRVAHTRDKAYIDKLNNGIDEERWKALDTEWAERIQLIDQKTSQLQKAIATSGAKELDSAFELLKQTRELYSRQDPFEQADSLRILVSNLTITDRNLEPNYRKPFDLVAHGTKTGDWYPREDSNLADQSQY
ncbi:recombinase family protein [Candidatus Bipolaricaulota bacterium]